MTDLKKIKLYEWFYSASMLIYALTLASAHVHPGVILSFLIILSAADMLLKKYVNCRATEDIIFSAYFAYCIISGIWTVIYGIPFRVYAGEVSTTVLPMFFYYAGRQTGTGCDGQDKAEAGGRWYRIFIWSVLFMTLLGLVLYIAVPQFYIDFLFRSSMISKADAATAHVRMNSVTGSTIVGALSVFAMAASIYFLEKEDRRSRIEGAAYLVVSAFTAFMSNQRAAMAVAILVLVYVNLIMFFSFHIFPKKYFLYECGIIAAGIALLALLGHGAFMKVYYRLVSLPDAFGERSDQWVGAVNNMKNMWLGDGLGSHGHRAAGFAEHVIADGGLVKIYCETGIIGTSLFIFLLLLIIKKSLKKLRSVAPELALIIAALLLSVGSNVLCFELVAPAFWFAAGRAVCILAAKPEVQA